jgi:N-dimethylarginine dimethylaminohydrolase
VENLRRSLSDLGLKVELIDLLKDLDDMVFAPNQVFVGEHAVVGKFIVPRRYLLSLLAERGTFYVERS